MAVQNNVGVGGRERLDDIYVTWWTDNEPITVDITLRKSSRNHSKKTAVPKSVIEIYFLLADAVRKNAHPEAFMAHKVGGKGRPKFDDPLDP